MTPFRSVVIHNMLCKQTTNFIIYRNGRVPSLWKNEFIVTGLLYKEKPYFLYMKFIWFKHILQYVLDESDWVYTPVWKLMSCSSISSDPIWCAVCAFVCDTHTHAM